VLDGVARREIERAQSRAISRRVIGRVELRGSRLGEDEWFLAAWFRFRPGDEKRARARIKELLAKRIKEQPLELPMPARYSAPAPATTLRASSRPAGLKGHEIGGARISEKHANFIVNPKERRAPRDIEALDRARPRHRKAALSASISVPEVRIVGTHERPRLRQGRRDDGRAFRRACVSLKSGSMVLAL